MNTLKKIFIGSVIGASVVGTSDLSIAQTTPKLDSQTNRYKINLIEVINDVSPNTTYNPAVEKALQKKTQVPTHWKKAKNIQPEKRPGLIYELETRLDNIVDTLRVLAWKEDGRSYEYRAEATTVLARNKRPAEALQYTISIKKDSVNEQPVGMARKIVIEDVYENPEIFIKKFNYAADKLPGKSLEESLKIRWDKANRDRATDKTNSPFHYEKISDAQLKKEVLQIEARVRAGKQAYRDYQKRNQHLESAPQKK